jgi:drug/metabolite transporter (DMT)-like permease
VIPTSKTYVSERTRGTTFGLLAAALFGLSAPISKLLLDGIQPVLLAGLLYLGAAIGLMLYGVARCSTRESKLSRSDLPKLAVVIVAGGVLGPVLMLFGLQRVSGLTGSLLLNLEAPLTMVLAVLAFREHSGKHAATAVAFILLGALLLKLEKGVLAADTSGVLLLAGACSCWALDNNLTQRLSLRDPFAIVRFKAVGAGVSNTVLGLAIPGTQLPKPVYLGTALVLGCFAYGISVVLDAYALRLVGAAREAAYFATAPFVGALASVFLLGDRLRWFDVLAMLSMALGVMLLVRERHGHGHAHTALRHEHLHEHDAHHQHQHGLGDPIGEPHSHSHRHEPLLHDHPHLPDAHHRHRH